VHPLLKRQLRRYYPNREVPADLQRLIAAIDQTYAQNDQDRQLLERSLELSSQELNDRYQVLEEQLELNEAAKRELEHAFSLLDTTFDAIEEGILVVDNQGHVVKFNNNFTEIWRPSASVLASGDDDLVLEDLLGKVVDPDAFKSKVSALYNDSMAESIDTVELIDGRILERFTRPQLSHGEPIGRVWSFRDISDRKAAENRLRLARRIFDASTQGIMVTDAGLHVMDSNRALCDLLGCEPTKIVGQHLQKMPAQGPCTCFNEDFVTQLTTEGEWWGEMRVSTQNHNSRVIWINFSAINNDAGERTHYVGIFSDISKLKEAEEQLQQLAYFDQLTGLPNRRMFKEEVEQRIAEGAPRQCRHALLYLDLDRFKFVNDSLGHMSGDDLLVRAAERICAEVREDDIASRQGGDEFAIALFDLNDEFPISGIASRIIEALSRPFVLKRQKVHIGVSIGICVLPQQAQDFEEAVRKADTAMYLAKATGKGCYRFWDEATQLLVNERIVVESELREAIRLGQLQLHFQPIVSCESGKPVSLEALVRWKHPQRGLVTPDQFIEVAEEVGLITDLENWVIDEACRQLRCWAEDGLPLVPVSVNVSAQHLDGQKLQQCFVAAMRKYQIPASLLSLEITESTAMREPNETIDALRALQALGVQSAIDDFGTGYSSLSYLKRLPTETLKIDRSFIKDIEQDANDRDISRAIIDLAHSLSMRVIAEGVEDSQQLALLRNMGCDFIQGWLFARPMPADGLAAYLRGTDAAESGTAASFYALED